MKLIFFKALIVLHTCVTKGLLIGGSSGSATYCALQAIKEKGFNVEGMNCVVLLPDSVRNYMFVAFMTLKKIRIVK